MPKLIFETLTNHDGTPVDPPHQIVKNVKQAVIRWETDDDGEHGQAGHTWLVVRNAGNHHHEIARMWEIGAWWNVGDYCYDQLRMEG